MMHGSLLSWQARLSADAWAVTTWQPENHQGERNAANTIPNSAGLADRINA